MIITKTPYRISFFGGGTDFEEYFSQYGGEVVGSTIDKYCYINVRKVPFMWNFKFRLRYHKSEIVKSVSNGHFPGKSTLAG